MKMIRWWGLTAFVIIVGLITAFNILFLDSIIKRSLENQASLLVGARVDIGDLSSRIFDLRVTIRNLEVTNPEQPMRNTIEAGILSFDMAAGPLLKKKVVIEKMEVKDLAFNTARKTSGALPDRLQKKQRLLKKPLDLSIPVKNRLEECVLPNFAAFSDIKKHSPEKLLGNVHLQSSDFIADYRNKVSTTRKLWEKRLEELPSKESLENDLKSLQNLMDQRPDDITTLPAYLKKIATARQRITNAKNSLAAAQRDFQTDLGNLKVSLSREKLEKLNARDIKAVMAKLNIKVPSSEDLVCVLAGKKIARKVNSAITWYRKINNLMSAGKAKGKKEKPHTVPRMKGVDVHFPITGGYPDFLIEKAVFSARPDLQAEPGKLILSRLSGNLKGLTTQPAIYGRPTLFNLKGSIAGGKAKKITLSGTLDHRGRPANDAINLTIKGFRLQPEDLAIPDKSPLELTSAHLNINSSLRAIGENLEGRVAMIILNPEVTVGPEASILADLFKNIDAFDIIISIGGTLNQPSLTLSSSLTNTLGSRLQNVFRNKLKGLRTNLREAIASRVSKALKEASRDTDSLEKLVLGNLSERLNISDIILKETSSASPFPFR
jgi:uncharacterized protein (TIGR03545 family)